MLHKNKLYDRLFYLFPYIKWDTEILCALFEIGILCAEASAMQFIRFWSSLDYMLALKPHSFCKHVILWKGVTT